MIAKHAPGIRELQYVCRTVHELVALEGACRFLPCLTKLHMWSTLDTFRIHTINIMGPPANLDFISMRLLCNLSQSSSPFHSCLLQTYLKSLADLHIFPNSHSSLKGPGATGADQRHSLAITFGGQLFQRLQALTLRSCGQISGCLIARNLAHVDISTNADLNWKVFVLCTRIVHVDVRVKGRLDFTGCSPALLASVRRLHIEATTLTEDGACQRIERPQLKSLSIYIGDHINSTFKLDHLMSLPKGRESSTKAQWR